MSQYLPDSEVFGQQSSGPSYIDPADIFGGAPAKKENTQGVLDKTVDVAEAVNSAVGQGIGSTQAAIGQFIQAPVANSAAIVSGASALADRGITGLINKVSPGSAELSPNTQDQARRMSEWATQSRAENVANGNAVARMGAAVQDDGRRIVKENKEYDKANNPTLTGQQQNIAGAEGFVDNVKAAFDNPLATSHSLIKSLPDMLLGMGVARTAATRVMGEAAGAAEAAAARAAAAGADKAAQTAAAELAVKEVQERAVSAASRAGVTSEAASSAMQGREGVYQAVSEIPDAKLEKSPRYQEILAKTGDAATARTQLANELADQVPGLTALGTAAGSLIANKLFGGDATAKTVAGVDKMTAREFGKRTAGDTVEEGLQGIPEDAVQYAAEVQADVDKKYDPAGSLAQNMVAGFAMGGGGHGASYIKDNAPAIQSTYKAFMAGRNKVGDPVGDASLDGDTQAPTIRANAAGTQAAPARPDTGDMIATGKAGEPSEAEKALTAAPTSLTSLDRVAEIDDEIKRASTRLTELNTGADYGPMFDGERAEAAAKAQELAQERESITKAWPKAVAGSETSFSTEAGARVNASYALIEAGDLVTSHDENLRKNPAYPQELQPRERDRAASELQVSGIVHKLDPARLGLSADAANGAPIVGADGLVESGNARTIAMKRVYQANGQKASDYKQFLRDNAAQFGLTPEAVDAMKSPMLVRVRTSQVNRAEFARQANASTVAQMSPSEQAKSDANRIDVMDDLAPDDAGDFANAASMPFIRRFLAKLPVTEQSGMIDADGKLSTAGYTRVRNAVLAKAYGDSPVLMRMVESMDDNLRNVSKALLTAAPKVATMRDAVKQGVRFDSDITPDLMAAVEELSRLKDAGTSISDALAQAGMFGDKYSQETRDLLQFLAENIRRPRRMADFIVAYMDALDNAGDPNQGTMFDEPTAPAKQDLIKAAKTAISGVDDGTAQDTQRGDAGKDTQPSAQAGGKPADAQSNQGGDQGAGAARPAAGGQEVSDDWVEFPKDSGTLGIPRAEMPQVKSTDRGALIQFLKGKGIEYANEEVAADTLKPTQAEYAKSKIAKHFEVHTGERSVLVSSDGHVLDGHHQWMAALATGEPVKVIRFDAPIRELLDAVFEYPGTRKGEGSGSDGKRAKAVADFKDAMGELVMLATKHTRMNMVPPNDPKVLAVLAKLFDAAIKVVGTDMKRAVAYVKDQLKKNPDLKTFWNKISNDMYQRAALDAVERMDSGGGLFGEASSKPADYDMANNYKPKAASAFISKDVLDNANKLIDKYFSGKKTDTISEEARAKANAALAPMIEAAKKDKPAFDQAVVDIAKDHGIGQMIPPLKSIERAAEKVVLEYEGKADQVADILRATVVVSAYEDAGKVVAAFVKKYGQANVTKIKNKTGIDLVGIDDATKPKVKNQDKALFGGYSDVSLIVKTPGGVLAEVQINAPSMLAAKDAHGHKLYEAARSQPKGSENQTEIDAAMTLVYDEAFNAASLRFSEADAKNPAASELMQMPPRGPSGGMDGRASSDLPSSDNMNQRPSGKRTKSSPLNVGTKTQPGGNLSGSFIKSPLTDSVAQQTKFAYTDDLFGEQNANSQYGDLSAQGARTKPAQAVGGSGQTKRLREQSGGPDQLGILGGDDAGPIEKQVGPVGAGGVRGQNENGARSKSGGGNGQRSGVPAGRDIPPKSGLNYEFGRDDLTYEGSWRTKAEQNIVAIELLRKLEAEKRQATREEQAVLAKFNGWGAGEIANTLFGPKLDKVASVLREYDGVIEAYNKLGRDYMNKGGQYRGQYADGGYFAAASVLRAAGKLGANEYPLKITRPEVEAVKPSAGDVKWLELRDKLKALLSKEEWAEASRSTQYAHYTSKSVVKSMWSAMERMGFKGGSILEPGAGIGVFAGLMPSAIANNSTYTGIEFDAITGGILKQLFPDERILVESFVDTKLPKNFYDVAIGNPPFSATKILGDPEYAKSALSLHDYFFAKSIDRVKPGGLVMYVTSRYTMDKMDDKARKYLSDRADLVGAIRLPQTAFQKNAGTEVVTDVIFLRKKVEGQTFEHAQQWLGVSEAKGADGNNLMVADKDGKEKPALINEYFAAHPAMVLGQHGNTGSMYSNKEYTVTPLEGDIEAHFAKAVENLPSDIYEAERGSSAEAAKVREIDFNPKAKKEGNYYVTDAGVLMVREGGVGQRVDRMPEKDMQMLKDFVPLRDALKQAHYDQLNNGDWESSLAVLNKAYGAFVKNHGQINQFTIKVTKKKTEDEETGETYIDEEESRVYTLHRKIVNDPDWTSVIALEEVNDDTGEIKKSAFLSDRVLGKPAEAKIDTPSDALLSSLNDIGRVDIPLISKRLGLDEADTVAALGTTIYEDPESGWQAADDYLSGNVKKKLENARIAAKADARYERNIAALESVQPEPKTPSEINASIGMNWIPGEVYQQFLDETAGVKARVEFNQATKQWIVQPTSGHKTQKATVDWGTDRRNAADLLEAALTGRNIKIETKIGYGSDAKAVFDQDATEAANEKLNNLKEAFQNWVWENADRTETLVRKFNDTFNTTVPRSFDGRHLTLPGMSKKWNVFDHVKRGAWRIIQRGNTYLAHAVGSGKTFQMIISAMEQKRLGMIKKPMMVVPNHMLAQFAREWKDLYPAARLMVADENNFHKDNRRRFVSRVALSDLDGVIITQSAFKLLDLDPEFKAKMINEQLEFMRASLEEAGGDVEKGGKSKDPRIKQIEKQIENMEQKLEQAMSSEGKDANVRFDELGVDFMYVDEAHQYRKLDFTTTRQVKGISPAGSGMAFDLYMKSRYLEERTAGRSLVMASGTPVTNTMAELYTVQRFMDNQALVDRGIDDFDSWAAMFGREKTALEPNAAGKYEPVTRFNKFVNVPELTQMFREFADVLNSDHLAVILGDKRPRVDGGSRKIEITPATESYQQFKAELTRRVEVSKAWKPTPQNPNNPDPIVRIIGDGRLAAIDGRFITPTLPNDPDSKLNKLIDGVIATHEKYADMEYKDKEGNTEPSKGAAQMVFSDLGFGADVAKNRGFSARTWFEKRLRDAGVNMSQVAFMSDYKKSSAKLKLYKDVNAGRIRILVGSSKNMGTGVNAQQRLIALHHLDSPWFPADLEQREGRIIRQGNKNPLVQIYAYAAKGTYDENMWKLLASKQYFIEQALSGDANVREVEDLDSQSQYDLVAAMAADDPRVLQLAGARADVEKLQRLYRAHEKQRGRFQSEYRIAKDTIAYNERMMPKAEAAAAKVKDMSGDNFTAKAAGKTYTARTDWAQALLDKLKDLTARVEKQIQTVGEISGHKIAFVPEERISGTGYSARLDMEFDNGDPMTLAMDPAANPMGMAIRATNALSAVATLPAKMRQRIAESSAQMDAIAGRLDTPFSMKELLANKIAESNEIEAAIMFDSKIKSEAPAPDAENVPYQVDGDGFTSAPTVNENTGYYETDLFGEPLPAPTKRAIAAKPAAPQLRGDAQPIAAVSDTPAPDGEYFVKTTIGSEVDRKMGADKVLNSGDLATATSYLYASAVERFDGVVTDKNGKILAVVGGFKGAISSAAVYPATIMAEAIRIAGAANIWFSHNHPSGKSMLSEADKNLWKTLNKVFKGSGIEPQGLIAVGDEEYSYVGKLEHAPIGIAGEERVQIPKARGEFKVPVMERSLAPLKERLPPSVSSPFAAKLEAQIMFDRAGRRSGIMMLNTKLQPIGWLPIGGLLRGELRNTGGMNALFRAASESSMESAIIVHDGELDGKIDRDHYPNLTIAENIGAALQLVDIRVLDILRAKPKTGFESAAEFGMPTSAGPVLSRSSNGVKGVDMRVLESLASRVKASMPNMPKVNVLADPSQAPQELRAYIALQGAWDDVEGAMHAGEFYLFASGLSDEARAEHVLAEHEAAHFGLRAILGPSLTVVMNHIYNNNASVRRAAKEFQKRGKLSNAKAAEEIIVDMPSSELAKLKGWRKLVDAVSEWLDSRGYRRLATMLQEWLDGTLTDQARADLFVANLVGAARDHMRGTYPAVFNASKGNTMLSDTLAADIAKQEKWLTAEAKARGFKSIEDLVDADYPLFEKLAKLWREKNPATNGVLLSRGDDRGQDAQLRELAKNAMAGGNENTTVALRAVSSQEADFLKSEGVPVDAGYVHTADMFAVRHALNRHSNAKIEQDRGQLPLTAGDVAAIKDLVDSPDAYIFGLKTPRGQDVIGRIRRMPDGTIFYLEEVRSGRKTLAMSSMRKYPSTSDFDAIKRSTLPTNARSDAGDVRIVYSNDILGKGVGQGGRTNQDIRLSRRDPLENAQARAEALIQKRVGTPSSLNAIAMATTRLTGINRLAGAIYDRAGFILDRYTPESVKAGLISDYGVPEAVIDQRAMLQGRQRVQLRKAGQLIDKLSTLTRAESQVAYEWMNMDGSDPQGYMSMMQGLPEESVEVLLDVQKMIDALSKEAVALGQLPADVYERNKFAYLRRSYAKHTLEMTAGEKKARAKAVTLLGDQYKGRGLSEEAPMSAIKASDWWKRKEAAGKADTSLKGEKFIRLERRATSGEGTKPLDGMQGKQAGKLLEVAYWPAGEAIPAKYADWAKAGTFEVRNVKGDKLVLWRDFTKEEREKMGEIDEARFAIAKTLHGMIHDVEVGRYLEWLGQKYAKPAGSTITGKLVEASERYRDTFAPDEWVQVPETKIAGTNVAKYGKLAGKYLPGPIWNDLRQTVNGQFKPLGEIYNQIQSAWKTSKTALSPAVHTNNVMSNLVMADWHDVSPSHMVKALRIMLAANQRSGKGLIGSAGNTLAGAGIADREAALEVFNRYKDSGGDIGSWATQEIAKDQIEPLLASIEKEMAITGGNSQDAQVGAMAALQHLVMLRFPSAFDAIKGTKGAQAVGTEAKNMMDLYQAEDDVFRLAAWLKAKEDGKSDMDAGKAARTSFLNYHINAPWINAMRNTGWPFISYTYRAVPMLLETAGKRPHKLLKLMAFAGALNALGVLLAGGDDDEERKLLPDEKAGKIWGLVPKLIRMPWNDANGSAVYLDIRRFIPVGDVFDVGAGHAAVPMLPGMMPGGPLALMGEIVLNKSAFTGKSITLETDTTTQKVTKMADYLWKAFAPNILGLPSTYATTAVLDAANGKTDVFGREQSTAQAMASSFGVKLGSYPTDVLTMNLVAKMNGEVGEIDANIGKLKRQLLTRQIDRAKFDELAAVEVEKKKRIIEEFRLKTGR